MGVQFINLLPGFTSQETAADPSSGNIEIIPSPKWVRVCFGGEYIADSKNVILLRQKDRAPVYYFPQQDVRLEYLEEKGEAFWTSYRYRWLDKPAPAGRQGRLVLAERSYR